MIGLPRTAMPHNPEKKLLEKAEFGELTNETYIFTHTAVVYTDGCQLYHGVIHERIDSDEDINFNRLKSRNIPLDHIYPVFTEEDFTQAPQQASFGTYIKRPSLLSYQCHGNDDENDTHICAQMRAEVEVCEMLRRFPHRNIAEYLGCIVEHGRVVALCYHRYTESLEQRVQSPNWDVDVDVLLGGIRSGIEHLHSIGYCHNDIHPGNIMFDESGTPIIIDFDSCRRTGDELGPKAGKPGFFPDGTQISQRQNDFYGLSKVEVLAREALDR